MWWATTCARSLRSETEPIDHSHGEESISFAESRNQELRTISGTYTHTDENSDRVGEFAIGTNIELKDVIGEILQDEKFPGVHTAFGNPYGGTPPFAKWYSSTHIDVVGRNFDIWVDQQQIMRGGQVLDRSVEAVGCRSLVVGKIHPQRTLRDLCVTFERGLRLKSFALTSLRGHAENSPTPLPMIPPPTVVQLKIQAGEISATVVVARGTLRRTDRVPRIRDAVFSSSRPDRPDGERRKELIRQLVDSPEYRSHSSQSIPPEFNVLVNRPTRCLSR